MWHRHGFWGMNLIWWIIWLLFIVWLFLTPWGKFRSRDSSYDMLRKRFANGEITEEEYRQRKKVPEEEFQKIREENR